ncbi:MAG: hypothetical protein Q4A82_00710 [Corynebacterium sp.]|nr:hypothetical protein [Corynebacterium sp.]
MSDKKYELTDEYRETKTEEKVYRIRATADIPVHGVNEGDLGGFIGDNAILSDDAWISGDAQVFGDAWVSGNAQVFGKVLVSNEAWVFGSAQVFGNALVSCNREIV